MLQAVIFDFGQTLVDSAHGFRTAEKQLQTRLRNQLPEVDSDEFLEFYRRQRSELQQRSDFSRKTLSLTVLEHFGCRGDPAVTQGWEDDYWQTVRCQTREFPEARGVLQQLGASFRLGLVTNTQGQGRAGTHRLSDFPELLGCFHAVIVAGEAGVPEKPDPRPFHACLQRLDCPAAQALYVGDDWRIDLCGARDAGLRAVWLQHQAARRTWPAVADGFPVIHSLDELLQFPLLTESGP